MITRTKIREKLFSVQLNVFLHQCVTKWRHTSLVYIQIYFKLLHNAIMCSKPYLYVTHCMETFSAWISYWCGSTFILNGESLRKGNKYQTLKVSRAVIFQAFIRETPGRANGLSSLQFVGGSPEYHHENSEIILRLSHDLFRPNSFQFINQSLNYWQRRKINHQEIPEADWLTHWHLCWHPQHYDKGQRVSGLNQRKGRSVGGSY